MPRKKTGYSTVSVEMPDGLIDEIRKDAERSKLKLSPWIARELSKRRKTKFVPPKLGWELGRKKTPKSGTE